MPEKPSYIPEENLSKINEKKDIKSEKPLFIMYRDNDLYTELVPKIKAELEDLGRTIEVITVPAGTSQEYMQDNWEEYIGNHREQLESSDILSDNTTNRFLYRSEKGTGNRQDLDLIAQETLIPLIFNAELTDKIILEKNYEAQAKAIVQLAETLKNNYQEIETATIIEYALNAHDFSMTDRTLVQTLSGLPAFLGFTEESGIVRNKIHEFIKQEITEETTQSLLPLIKRAIDYIEEGNFLKMVMRQYQKTSNIEEFRSDLKEQARILDKYGLLSETIHRGLIREFDLHDVEVSFNSKALSHELGKVFGEKNVEVIKSVEELSNKQNTVSIVDRHHIMLDRDRSQLGPYNVILPVASAVLDLINKGEIQVDKQGMDDSIKKVIDKYYNSEAKSEAKEDQ